MGLETKVIDKVALSASFTNKYKERWMHSEFYAQSRVKIKKKYESLASEYKWIKFEYQGKKGWYCVECETAIPIQSNYNDAYQEKYWGIQRSIINKETTETLFSDCPEEILKGIMNSRIYNSNHYVGYGYDSTYTTKEDEQSIIVTSSTGKSKEIQKEDFIYGSFCIETKKYAEWNDKDSIKVGTVYMSRLYFFETFLVESDEEYSAYQEIVLFLKDRDISEISDTEVNQLLAIMKLDGDEIRKGVEEAFDNFLASNLLEELEEELEEELIQELLASDHKRADLEYYDRKCLDDIKMGHWDLWKDIPAGDSKGQLQLTSKLVARNPVSDIHPVGLIGIDFGTKSTIVARLDEKRKPTLMRVGIGKLSKDVQPHHYENPTIMEFIDLEEFLKAYKEKDGRPETSINDLRISHAAENGLKSCDDSDIFYSFFYDLKQWCGDTTHSEKLIDQMGMEQVLPSFVNMTEEDLNPLELYAYYLGLYINNMVNGIYLDYVLSFPVTYKKEVKEKIVESFYAGIKKSLPESIVHDEEVMKKFRVRQGVSEPAAYAITALKNYGFEPDENEKYFYSIFDFGGGTTDFDFGIWRAADDSKREEESYDYVIEHFGSEGDRYLGGENLLELLAFEIFKANAKLLQGSPDGQKVGFSFSKAKECDDFPGSELLISTSQEARRNTKQLMEVLRPFWEGIIGKKEVSVSKNKKVSELEEGKNSKGITESKDNSNVVEYKGYLFRKSEEKPFPINVDEGSISVDLFDKNGEMQSGKKLYIESEKENIHVDLLKILKDRIERGVVSFFDSVMLAVHHESVDRCNPEGIEIFLAGNSSKSPLLLELFEKHIKEERAKMPGVQEGQEYFHLYPPLGTEEAVKMQKERKVVVDENDITAPTGKTGVAYGLIEGREGGKIKVISEISAEEETKFRYNIGYEKRGKFKMVLDRNEVEYKEWVRFGNAGKELEFYFTSTPAADKMSIEDATMHRMHCQTDVDLNKDIYIRTVAPEEVEYILVNENEEPSAKAKGYSICLA